ncbi:MAG TPA: M15 family metallopeptidase [Candidatus Saccharibacteria bacterium]|nr:M15 family metallopeptidase [Candidatus Saccharibacteria bacterium]
MKNEKLLYAVAITLLAIFAFGQLKSLLTREEQRAYKSGEVVSSINKTKYSTSEPASLWVIVNKQNPLPKTYSPANLSEVKALTVTNPDESKLREDANKALADLVKSAGKEKLKYQMISGYRSYDLQNIVYGGNVSSDGQKKADDTSARPGHSEHQTGLAVDLGRTDGKCRLETCFGDTPEGKWLADNAYKFGFIVRYQQGEQGIVGYSYEPWHLRYVGKELADELFKKDLTMEEFFGYPAAPDYK